MVETWLRVRLPPMLTEGPAPISTDAQARTHRQRPLERELVKCHRLCPDARRSFGPIRVDLSRARRRRAGEGSDSRRRLSPHPDARPQAVLAALLRGPLAAR